MEKNKPEVEPFQDIELEPKVKPTVEKPKTIDFSKLIGVAKDFMPDVKDLFKKEKKDPSTMCEFTIKGNDEFVLDCLDLILKK